jgi:putative ABC transport system ATP-binding protein
MSKSYDIKGRSIPVLKGVDLQVAAGDFISIMGPSGSGKSTLLHLIGMLDRPDTGQYLFKGRSILNVSDQELSAYRSRAIGFVFQTFNLIPSLSVLENVKLPFLYASGANQNAHKRSIQAIEQVGLKARMDHKPSELSGGEMQRVAIARAIAIEPEIILADEPTGNLDSVTGKEILTLLSGLNQKNVAVVMITHDAKVAAQAHIHITIKDGKIRTGDQ